MTERPPSLCSDRDLQGLAASARTDSRRGIAEADALLVRHPGDPRLHFLRGSLLAGEQEYAAAQSAMRRAVELAPGFGLARFQLGLLHLTSGDAASAEAVWAPLDELPRANPLLLFSRGLRHLARDEWDACVRDLEEGMTRNTDNPPLNANMAMVIAEVRQRDRRPSAGAGGSSVGLLLQQAALKATKH